MVFVVDHSVLSGGNSLDFVVGFDTVQVTDATDAAVSEVRAIAEQQKLPSAKRKDSQGICFLGKINYNDFIERYLGKRTASRSWECNNGSNSLNITASFFYSRDVPV